MPTVCFTVSASDLTRIANALSVRWGYSATLPDGSQNPQSAGDFVRLKIAAYACQETLAHERAIALAAVAAPVSIVVT